MAPPVSIALSLFLSFTIAHCLEFNPVTENVSVKAIYRLQTFVNKEPHSISEIHEHYQHNLASSNIWIRRHVDGFDSSPVKRYLYNAELGRDVEMVGDHDPGQLYLYQSGSDPSATGGQQRVKRVESFHLHEDKAQGSSSKSNSLDSVIYKLYKGYAMKPSLNLDLFLEKGCRDKMEGRLHYVRGLTRLLEMIECRRTSFKLDSALTGASDSTRGVRKTVYYVKKLTAITGNSEPELVKSLDMTVSVEKRKTTAEQVLPARLIPLSLSLEFNYDETEVLMIINVYQFEIVPLNEHLMSWESLYLLPKASGFDDLLATEYAPHRHRQQQPRQPKPGRNFPKSFSFIASMTGSHLKVTQDPIELSVVYDVKTRVLARQLSLIDRGQVVGDSYQRHVSRLVYDYPSKYKFHIKHQNNDYFYPEHREEQNPDDYYWRQCASNLIADSDLVKLETGGSRVFNLDKAIYLGRERVRGIICNVYELRTYGLPLWMGWEDFENYYWIKSNMHATIYEAASYVLDRNYGQEPNDFSISGKIVRLQVNIVPHDSSDIMSYTLDMHHFEWEVSPDLVDLMDIGQDCFLASSSVRHVDMSLALEPLKVDMSWSKFSYQLAHDATRRRQTVAKLLSRGPFHISPIQQIELKTSISPGNLLEARLAVYEQPQNRLRISYLGFAEDLSLGSARANSWHQGATSLSLQECNWRAAHTLKADAYTSTYRGPASEQKRLLMYCAHSFHCVLDIDSSWTQADGKLESVRNLFRYPVSSDHPQRCALVEVRLEPMNGSPHVAGAATTRPLEWLAKVEAELVELRQAVEIELEQEEEEEGGEAPVMRVAKLELSHIVQPDEQVSGALKGPLKGLGYFGQDCSSEVEIKVSSVAQCSHQCLMSAHCRSYSLCHHQGHLDCLLTRVNWTEPAKIEELRSLVHVPLGLSRKASIEVRLEDGSSERLTLNRSPLCSIHERRHLELFKFKNSSLVPVAPAVQLLRASSPDQCARHCLHRVQMMAGSRKKARRDEEADEEEEEDTCLAFRFSRSLNLCELLPGRAFTLELRESLEGGSDLSWSKKLPRFDEMETYELQHELLFEPKADLRLVLEGRGEEKPQAGGEEPEEESSWRWQMTVARACSAQMCAHYCLLERNCRSFDLLAPSSGGQHSAPRQLASAGCLMGELCVLNGLALDDIRNQLPQQQHGFVLKRPSTQTEVEANRWWHYEPSQLARFVAFGGRRRRPRAAGERAQTTRGIFISGGGGAGAMAAPGRHEHVKSGAASDGATPGAWWPALLALCLLLAC